MFIVIHFPDSDAAQYAGLSPAVIRHVFYSGTRITVYERLRASWSRRPPEDLLEPQSGGKLPQPSGQSLGLVPKLAMGAIAGATGQLVAVPADLIKV